MPVKWLTEPEHERLSRFPAEIQPGDVIAFFTLTDADLKLVKQHDGEANRRGFALQLCALRYLGFIPDDLKSTPASAIGFLSRQLGASAEAIADYSRCAARRQSLGRRQPPLHEPRKLSHPI
ncbi:MAG: DUF4158 domain-containing protein [Blastocatellia bacterium]